MDEKDLIFGKFGGWRNIKMDSFLMDAKDLTDSLIEFEHALLVGYIYFVLARKDYVLELPKLDLCTFPDSETWVETILDLRYKFLFQWIMGSLSPDSGVDEELVSPGYIILKGSSQMPNLHIYISFLSDPYFENYKMRSEEIAKKEIERFLNLPKPILQEPEGKEKIIEKILSEKQCHFPTQDFVVDGPTYLPSYSKYSEGEIENTKKTIQNLKNFNYIPSFVFIDPRLIKEDESKYVKIEEDLKSKYGWDLLKSSDDLLGEFVEKKDRERVEREWEKIRNKTIKEGAPTTIKPFVIWALNSAKLEEMQKKLSIEFPKLIEEGKTGDAIRKTGILCETLFSLMYEEEYKSHNKNFRKTLIFLKDKIAKEYSENLVNGLHFIYDWRNKPSHSGGELFTSAIAHEVLFRAQLVYALFMKRKPLG